MRPHLQCGDGPHADSAGCARCSSTRRQWQRGLCCGCSLRMSFKFLCLAVQGATIPTAAGSSRTCGTCPRRLTPAHPSGVPSATSTTADTEPDSALWPTRLQIEQPAPSRGRRPEGIAHGAVLGRVPLLLLGCRLLVNSDAQRLLLLLCALRPGVVSKRSNRRRRRRPVLTTPGTACQRPAAATTEAAPS